MKNEAAIIELGNNWFLDTPSGRLGPMGSRQEANDLLVVLACATAARSETACTDAECFI